MSNIFGNTNNNNTSAAPAPQFSFNNQAPASTAQPGTSLFGQSNPSVFGAQSQHQTGSGAAGLFQPQAQTQPSGQSPSTFAAFTPLQNAAYFPANLSLAQQQDLARSRLQQAGISGHRADEKSVIEQADTLVRKYDPRSQDTILQTYLYNAVNSAYAPFYYRNPEEKEAAYEKALSEAPKMVTEGGESMKFVPVLVRGFHELGQRVKLQAETVKAMQERLHEMNNSLEAVMQTHQQRITVQLESCRRQHAALANRTLRLAVKLQVLRNRGYALDTAEESLRKQLLTLATQVNDPVFAAREEEIWARMVSLRERARWLEEEGKRVGVQVQEQAGGVGGVPEYVVEKTKKILGDYDGQLRHLARELAEVQGEYVEWESAQRGRR